LEQANLQITREPLKLPFIKINPSVKNLEDFKYEDFEIIDYESHPAISAPISV
jgi:thymidylate synthase